MEVISYLLGKKSGGGGDEPTGTIEITSNGVKNVKSYASANVNVQPDLESKSITITENTTTTITPTTGKDGLSSVQVTTNVSGGGGGHDWSAIGYSEEPQSITDGYNYAVQIKNNWEPVTSMSSMFLRDKYLFYMPLVDTSSTTDMTATFQECDTLSAIALLDTSNVTLMSSMFSKCYSLVAVPQFDTSNVANLNGAFQSCTILKDVPQFNTSSCNDMRNMFSGCLNLTDNSLDNILQMCINVKPSYSKTKTLSSVIGSNSTIYPSSRIQALTHYQDFIDAGWTIGY